VAEVESALISERVTAGMKAAEARRIPACDRHLNGIVSNRRRGGQKADGLALSMSFRWISTILQIISTHCLT
jgi:hypothetical protein